ncbi:MAG: recombinase family protein, partial [Bacteroidota bacterium]
MFNSHQKLFGGVAAIYRRKSQESDERQTLSLSTQNDICNEIVVQYGFQVLKDFEEKKSAKTPDQRPKFVEMMDLVLKRKIDVVVAWKIDRLARNMKEGGWLIDLLQQGFIKAIVTKDKIYYPDDNTIITSIEMASATEYSRELSKKVKAGLDKKARKGIPNGHAPIGYLNNKHKVQGERDWRDDPMRLPLVRQIFRKLLEGTQSAFSVWKWANENIKLTTPQSKKLGGALLSKSGFYRMLKRPEYAGFFIYEGQKIKISCITPILTESEYWRVQQILGKKGVPRPKGMPSVYTGFLFSPKGSYCGADSSYRVVCDCGCKFSAKTKTACPKCHLSINDMQHPRHYFWKYYYIVSKKKAGLPCKYVNEKALDSYFVQYVTDNLLFSKSFTNW